MINDVRDIMADAPTAVDARASVTAVAQVMRERGTGLVMVVADRELVGLVDKHDLVEAVGDGADPRRVPVARAVPREAVTVRVDEDVRQAGRRMRAASARYAVVVAAGEPVGLVRAADAAAAAPSAPPVAPTPDLHGSP
ncbi:cyclic nucleotide-binding/CBS domain-containing protein [Streptomyces sp. Da 82-17]|uniref:CBS domain-containing protein n=1 Tax=Streptomyces sp. Da 82-17 TaxID=3377116 RepID=UPI0038D41460